MVSEPTGCDTRTGLTYDLNEGDRNRLALLGERCARMIRAPVCGGICDTSDTIPLCRYEELARRENRLRKAKASVRIAAPDQLPGADNLEREGIDVSDRLPGKES